MPDTERGTLFRRGVLIVSALLGVFGLFWIGRSFLVGGKLRFGNPRPGERFEGGPVDLQPRQVRAEVTRVRGAQVARPGDKCEFLIERRVREGVPPGCNAQVVCAGRLLYGGPELGFFPCKLFDDGDDHEVIGSDPHTTGADHDGAFSINSREGVMRVWDDATGPHGEFILEAEVLSIL